MTLYIIGCVRVIVGDTVGERKYRLCCEICEGQTRQKPKKDKDKGSDKDTYKNKGKAKRRYEHTTSSEGTDVAYRKH